MCEPQWFALAELQLHRLNSFDEISCLCSRVLIRNSDENSRRSVFSIDNSASDEEEPLIEDEALNECSSLPHILKNKPKQDVDAEPVSCASCYCSASHTDNLSTDEHDSLRDSHEPHARPAPFLKGLQSSDSGADLTECLKHDLDAEWQKFWSLNGEKLIWESWIAHYSAYINPSYMPYAQQQATSPQKRAHLALDLDTIAKNDSDAKKTQNAFKQRLLVRNLSGSDEDKVNGEVSEGWNPLSPVSVDCETDIEHLLSSRCGSHASSVRTVDSMTNVTRMTISPLESSHSSESFSSVSSVQSSLSSTSSEENEEDYQHQWHVLWKKHYEEEWRRQYDLFGVLWRESNDQIVPIAIDLSVQITPLLVLKPKKKDSILPLKGQQLLKHSSRLQNHLVQSLGTILSDLKMSDESSSKMEENQPKTEEENNEENIQMANMGLPTSFGSSLKRDRQNDTENDQNDGYDFSADFESDRKRLKAALSLIGLPYNENSNTPFSGQVNYKMKNIRSQNRYLAMRHETKPKHIRFDDDGNVQSEDFDKYQGVLPDILDDKLSSGDEDIDVSTSKIEESADDSFSKRKKRKRKLLVPPEIKENPHLKKFWHRRFELFTKFDEGIKLDLESWYSVTPEKIAKHIADRCKCGVIVDGFCGAGGNTIQFAQTCNKVIAIDIDPKKIELARNNAQVYGVADRIEFIVGDFFHLSHGLKADVVFFSPPWGGPKYMSETIYDLESMLQPVPLSQLLEAGRRISNNLAVFLPKNSNSFLLFNETTKHGKVEIEQNFSRKRLTSITAYYNELVKKIR